MTTWTREHDDLIARVAEGGIAQQEKGIPARLWKYKFPDGRREHLPTYSTNLAACFRAAEAYAKQHNAHMNATISIGRSGNVKAEVNMIALGGLYIEGETEREPMTPSQALAWALYNAVKGIK